MLRTRMRLDLRLVFRLQHSGEGEWGVPLLSPRVVVPLRLLPLLLVVVVVLVPSLVHTMLGVR